MALHVGRARRHAPTQNLAFGFAAVHPRIVGVGGQGFEFVRDKFFRKDQRIRVRLGNVLKIQDMLLICAEHLEEKDSKHQMAAVLGVALIAMGDC